MMTSAIPILLTVLAAAPDPRVERVVAAVGEKGCPKLYGMLAETFQEAAPAEIWPSWCASVGSLADMEALGTKDGWLLFRGKSPVGEMLFDVAFDSAGKVAGLRVSKAESAGPATDVGLALDEKLLQVKEKYGLPGLTALVLRNGKGVMLASVGVRKLGDSTPVTLDDKWHLGSDTKAMTATLAALLVEEKKLKWTSTVTDVLPRWKDIHPDYAKVTLEMLLACRGGLPPNVPNEVWKKVFNPKDPAKERTDAVRAALRIAPQNIGAFVYSNAGYMVAGVMIEEATGQTWEAAMRQRLFAPLHMASCGFGPPASPGKIDQPWAHRFKDGALSPVEPGPESDNPLGLGPAGTVHCSMADWSKFAGIHLKGARGEKTILTDQTIQKLQTVPVGGKIALGWAVEEPPWAGGKALRADGSNTMYYSRIWVVPSKNAVFLIATNSAADGAEAAMDEVSRYFGARYGN